MQELYKLIIGILVLIAGIPIGDFLVRKTKEELKEGRIWFKGLAAVCLIGAVISLIFRNDALLFGLLFIAIVTSRSLKKKYFLTSEFRNVFGLS
jgi:uncharacterized membrane protein YfcA